MSVSAETIPAERTYSFTQRLAAEGFGAFLLVFAGVGTALYAALTSQGSGPLIQGLAFGLALLIAMSVFSSISGGHLNPAVTFGHAIAGRTPWREVPGYVVAQTLGALAGSALLFIILSTNSVFTESALAQGAPKVADFFTQIANQYDRSPLGDFSMAGVLLTEVIAVAVFVGIFLAVTRPGFKSEISVPAILGVTYTLMVFVTLPVSNAALNPARATSVAIFADGALGDLWLFWVAPLAGGALAALLSIGLGVDRVLEPGDSDPAPETDGAAEVEFAAVEVVGFADAVEAVEPVEVADVEAADDGFAAEDSAAADLGAEASDLETEAVEAAEVTDEQVVETEEAGEDSVEDASSDNSVAADHPDAGTTYAVKVAAGADTYHLPGSRYYEKTVAVLYFLDEQSAKDAGYRKAGTRKK